MYTDYPQSKGFCIFLACSDSLFKVEMSTSVWPSERAKVGRYHDLIRIFIQCCDGVRWDLPELAHNLHTLSELQPVWLFVAQGRDVLLV